MTTGTTEAGGAVAAPVWRRSVQSPLLATLRRLVRHRSALVGIVVLAALILIALAAPLVAPYDPTATAPRDRTQPPSASHLFGTDNLGRDVFSAVIWGTRISLQVGLIAVGIGATVGVLCGLVAGYYGGWLDMVLMRLIDAFRVLEVIYILTFGGPGDSTEILSLHIYKTAFVGQRLGTAAAISVLLLVVVAGLSWLALSLSNPLKDGERK